MLNGIDRDRPPRTRQTCWWAPISCPLTGNSGSSCRRTCVTGCRRSSGVVRHRRGRADRPVGVSAGVSGRWARSGGVRPGGDGRAAAVRALHRVAFVAVGTCQALRGDWLRFSLSESVREVPELSDQQLVVESCPRWSVPGTSQRGPLDRQVVLLRERPLLPRPDGRPASTTLVELARRLGPALDPDPRPKVMYTCGPWASCVILNMLAAAHHPVVRWLGRLEKRLPPSESLLYGGTLRNAECGM